MPSFQQHYSMQLYLFYVYHGVSLILPNCKLYHICNSGGILDRVDSYVFTGALCYSFVRVALPLYGVWLLQRANWLPCAFLVPSAAWSEMPRTNPFTAQYGPPAQWNFVSGCKVRSSLFLREHQWDTTDKQVFLRMDQVCSFLSTRMVKTYHFGVHSFLTFCRVKGRLITELHILWSVLRWLMGNGSWEPNYTLLIPKLFWYPKAYLATTWLVLRFIDVIFDFGWSISICIELQQ
jgi:hypothetical protein